MKRRKSLQMRHDLEKSWICNKVRYPSKKDAQTKLNSMRGFGRKSGKKLRIYPCPNCKGWHLSHIKYHGRQKDNHGSRNTDEDQSF